MSKPHVVETNVGTSRESLTFSAWSRTLLFWGPTFVGNLLRSKSFRFPGLVIIPLVAAGAVAVSVGCGSDAASLFDANKAAEAPAPDENRGDGTTFGSATDASATANSPFRGSPLCRATSETCLPDDDGTRQ